MAFLGYVALVVGLLLVGVGSFLLYRGYVVWRNEPVSAEGARLCDGTVEVKGVARPVDEGELFGAKYTGDEVIGHEWARKKKNRNSSTGTNKTWSTEESGEEAVPFYVEDETGRIAVDPEEANLSFEKEVINRTPAVKKEVGTLKTGDDVHVIGQRRDVVEKRGLDGANVCIRDGEATPLFRITDGDETTVVKRLSYKGGGIAAIGLFFAVAGGYVVL